MTSPVASILNFRDVGKTVNDLAGRKVLKEGALYRSARPDEATQPDRDRLINDYGIKTVIDLRTKTEHIEQAKKRDAKIAAAAASPEILPVPDEVPAGPLEIPGVDYKHINFNGRAYANSLLAQLSWSNYFWVIAYMATGYRKDAIKIISKEVMTERKLTGLATDSIDACTAEVRQFFDVLADPNRDGAILIHCTQGKDRTGLTVLLVLLLLGIEHEHAHADYMMSQQELEIERAERCVEIQSIGLPEWFLDCDPKFVGTVDAHLIGEYGGVENYLELCGVDAVSRNRVREALLAR